MDRYFYRSRTPVQPSSTTKKQRNKVIELRQTFDVLSPSIPLLRAPVYSRHSSPLDPQLPSSILDDTEITTSQSRRDSTNADERTLSQNCRITSTFHSFCRSSFLGSSHTTQPKYSPYVSSQALIARFEVGMDNLLSHTEKNSVAPSLPHYEIKERIRVRGFREDFYSTGLATLTSWAHAPWEDKDFVHSAISRTLIRNILSSDVVLYSDGANAQTWSAQWGSRLFLQTWPNTDTITCMAISNLGLVLLGYESGKIVIVDLVGSNAVATAVLGDLYASSLATASGGPGFENKTEVYATNILWLQQTRASGDMCGNLPWSPRVMERLGRRVEFFLGDSRGHIAKVAVTESRMQGLQLRVLYMFPSTHCHSDTISSMAVDVDERHLIVGGSDSYVTVWAHSPITGAMNLAGYRTMVECEITFLHELPQKSAVRALAFGPGHACNGDARSLYVTGGGRHDRTLRVYELKIEEHNSTPFPDVDLHSTFLPSAAVLPPAISSSSDLVFRVPMPAQIVDVVWLSATEVLVALGHSRVKRYKGLAKILDVQTGDVVATIPGEGYALEAAKTQQGFCITTSMNILYSGVWHTTALSHTQSIGPPELSRLR